ncbi:MAG: 50S ribosomal protein L15 [Chloroflexi bacterium]|jgi:large subunit ribosomal protein L15|nr:50S ribosomal protein L15 [Chloroflexota bacterium]MBT3669339.1 50S ribosomal protein L15 [Chloroflexota bacterium]MBT4003462.1 50S ribosomal protein L15 [Chloroflexota bacterium]MBT4306046.1 50S ribosomal protein L15 [Chloroflexota bacterium]MBT4532690.1 50S ribosomal protein L15 [Chloroflexota bacterium]
MDLHDLKPNEGKKQKRIRVARGTGGKGGKTAGRGTKGYGARSGSGGKLYREGGNLPFFRRLPFKRGFTPPNQTIYNEINLDQLEGFRAKAKVNPETLDAARLLRKPERPVVIMGRGDVKKAYTVQVHRVTAGARSKIEAAGGTVEIIE